MPPLNPHTIFDSAPTLPVSYRSRFELVPATPVDETVQAARELAKGVRNVVRTLLFAFSPALLFAAPLVVGVAKKALQNRGLLEEESE